ncbi:hypothetical protein [Microbacterium sp.]|uniref:hypothetical protein n=1 Tax=Microbacterium sp. TaxID=51671 RepID=UPI003A8A53D7
MRTTLTLDDDVARLLDDAVHRDRRTMKDVVNDALRRGLAAPAEAVPAPYVAPVHSSGLRAGIDVARLNQLIDDLHVADSTERLP